VAEVTKVGLQSREDHGCCKSESGTQEKEETNEPKRRYGVAKKKRKRNQNKRTQATACACEKKNNKKSDKTKQKKDKKIEEKKRLDAS